MKFLMPDEKSVLAMLGALFGDDTSVTAAAKQDQPSDWVATFVTDDNTLVAACVCTKEFVAYAGAALMMLPAAQAKKAAADGNVCEVTTGSFHEIMNICSRFLMNDHTPHLRLGQVCRRGDAAGFAELEKAGSRKDFKIAIPKYGSGQLACVVT